MIITIDLNLEKCSTLKIMMLHFLSLNMGFPCDLKYS